MVAHLPQGRGEERMEAAWCFYSPPQKHFLPVYLDVLYPADQRRPIPRVEKARNSSRT